jgi:hypothetical protein
MSRENVEVVRRMNAAFNRGDEGWVGFYEPDVEFRASGVPRVTLCIEAS